MNGLRTYRKAALLDVGPSTRLPPTASITIWRSASSTGTGSRYCRKCSTPSGSTSATPPTFAFRLSSSGSSVGSSRGDSKDGPDHVHPGTGVQPAASAVQEPGPARVPRSGWTACGRRCAACACAPARFLWWLGVGSMTRQVRDSPGAAAPSGKCRPGHSPARGLLPVALPGPESERSSGAKSRPCWTQEYACRSWPPTPRHGFARFGYRGADREDHVSA